MRYLAVVLYFTAAVMCLPTPALADPSYNVHITKLAADTFNNPSYAGFLFIIDTSVGSCVASSWLTYNPSNNNLDMQKATYSAAMVAIAGGKSVTIWVQSGTCNCT